MTLNRTIKINDLMSNQASTTIIDVRSPSEFQQATIPGSVNIPLFDDNERAEIGTIYKQLSPQAAEERGLEIVSAKLPAFIRKFKEIEGEKTVFCWRGGMRSKTTATLLDLMKIHVYRLEGGYRAYRHWVVGMLESFDFKPKAYILNGYTGTGKTAILRRLQEEGYPVIDLEKMANHRGSIFGQIGLEPHNQKKFDSLLVERIIELADSPYILFEGESRRIGRAALPLLFEQFKDEGVHLSISLPIEERIHTIIEDYVPWQHRQACIEAFQRIKSRIHTPVAKQIEEHLHAEEYREAVRLLLEYYYDPRYRHAEEQYADNKHIHFEVDHVEEGIHKLKEILHEYEVKAK